MIGLSSEEDLCIVICGEAGQGIQTVEAILVQTIKKSGYNVFSTKEYMSRVRGGENSTEIYLSSKRVRAYRERIDILLSLSKGAIDHLKTRISPETLIIGDEKQLKNQATTSNTLEIPLLKMAQELGGPIFSNVIVAGVISRILNVPMEIFNEIIRKMFSRKGEKILYKDLEAGKRGYETGRQLLESGKIILKIKKNPEIKNEILLNGTEAVALGCIAGGCRFMSSYPMTPSTPLQVFIAGNAEEFGMVFEQAEDEIAAINMALGASYAGARSMVATSGSGFALMEEAVGLSGMIETPVVIYIGQRPGPAVGLPTRTSQEDLNLALYSGPGEFPRIILAPGTIEDAFYLSFMAFNLAERYHGPVFILSDQYFADVFYNLPSLDLKGLEIEDHIHKTSKDYKRYQITPEGISPRGIPGHGEGLVVVDSDEHDEEGHLTENLDIRTAMVDKRLRKRLKMEKEAIPPDIIGVEDYDTLAVGWGSTYGIIKEALEKVDDETISFLHFKQLYPLHKSTLDYLTRAQETIIFENNAQSQFANLIKLETGFEIDEKILKYNGMPFSVEEVAGNLIKYGRG